MAAAASATATAPFLELRMGPRAEDVHRPTVCVESGIPEVLVVGGEPERPEEIDAVEDLEDPLGGLAEVPVSDEAVDTAHGEILSVYVRDPAEAAPHARDVEGAVPCGALRHGSESEGSIRGIEGVYLRLAVRVHRSE